jgi:hypothetical protein
MPHGEDGPPREFFIEFELRNACVTYFNDRFSMYRSSFISLHDQVDAMVHGFTEYTFGYQRLAGVRARAERDQGLLKRCEWRQTAIGIPFSCNNIYHQAFHAVPAWELWHEKVQAASAAGRDSVDFLPLVYPSAAVGKKMSDDPRRWHAWEFSLRPFTTRSYDDLAARTSQLIHAPCRCYDVVHGNAPAFNPIARAAAPRLRRFRLASLHNIPSWSPPTLATASSGVASRPSPSASMLWIVRNHALRNIANEAKLAARIARDPVLSGVIKRVALESMPLSEQMRLIAGSAGLLAVHGQAMAWVLFLGAQRRAGRTAAIEIFPPGLYNTIYRELSMTLSVQYEELRSRAADGCKGSTTATKLLCNVTVSVEKVAAAATRAVAWMKRNAIDVSSTRSETS